MKGKEMAHPDPTGTRWLFDLPDMRRWFEGLPMRFTDFAPMRIEQEMTDDAFVVKAEMPGIDPERDADV